MEDENWMKERTVEEIKTKMSPSAQEVHEIEQDVKKAQRN